MKQKQGFFIDTLSKITKYFLVLIVIVLLYLLCSGIRVIDSGNVAIVLRFGEIVGDTYEEQIHKPGLLWAMPYFVDEVIVLPSDNVMERIVLTHYTEAHTMTEAEEGYLITGDQNIAVVSASVKYVVSDPVAYALNVADVGAIIDATVSTGMVNEAAKIGVDELLTSGKDAFGKAVLEFATKKLNKLGAGVKITSLELTQVAMPEEVRDLYDQVNAATVQAETVQAEARIYRENVIPQAHSDCDSMISNAKSIYSTSVAEAKSKLSNFYGYVDEFEVNPDVVKTRLYNDYVKQAMKKIGTVRIVQDGETNIIINPKK